jgi:glycosyltransferase involved in cell wall biosynthesis
VCKALIPHDNVLFPETKFNDKELNYLYNSIDLYINLASNEGFGLGSCEALHAGKPIVVNVTGGLQDQCGFKNEKGEYLTADDYKGQWGSNHDGRYQDHGEWVKPVFPATISLQGSPMTPYIFDDRCRWDEAGEAIKYWYDMGPEERKRRGEIGRKWVMSKDSNMDAKHMCNLMKTSIENTFTNWKPREKYTMEVI